MEAGAHVWCQDTDGDEAWILAEVTKKSPDELHLFQVDKPENEFVRQRLASSRGGTSDEPVELKYEGVELANAKLSDADRASGQDDDLIHLPHLHEPAILHAIAERFDYGKIYTWTGPVLIAVNPFQRLPLYTREILESYRREGLLRSQNLGETQAPLGPHVYSVADKSYRQMMSEKRKSQAVLISGESGAGKTESTKIVMLYLTTLGSSHKKDKKKDEESDADLSIMERVLQSNPVLEAFGNARTLRNDNSSRFGKFIELGFSRSGTLLGAKVQTYLLEKVRLGFHASGERNYHIFYQLLRGATEEQKKKYEFHEGLTGGLELANYFHYTGQGGAPQLREFTDESGLKYTLKAMSSLGWEEEKIDTVLSLIAGLLHLGQITFDSTESEGGVEIAVIADDKILNNSARMLGVDVDKLKTALTERLMVTRGDAITIQLTPNKAVDARDALAKTMYGALFLWVVSQVNGCIGWENDSDVRSSIGVLDIFGFECFAINSFEQLCINFTNEALQQQFNKFIFKMEQAEYESEEINWDTISFPDNQDCLDTIQQKGSGILAILDDECRLPKGSDRNYANRLYKNFIPNKGQVESDNTRFSATPVQKSRGIFCVRHFAGVVQYTAETGFMEKNKDEIPLTAKNLFDTAPSWLIKDIIACQMKETQERAPPQKPGARGKPAKTKTVGMQFKEQLQDLMERVESTEPHYIRCLKPNDAAKPKLLTRKRLTEQLRYGGVLEAVRVARMGFPVRLEHAAFFKRYRMLLPTTPDNVLAWSMDGAQPQNLCVKLVDLLLEEGAKQVAAKSKGIEMSPNEEGISRAEKIRRTQRIQPDAMTFPKTDVQLGVSKVFMRKPPHDALESHRVFHQHASATFIQCWVRGLQERRRYLILWEAALTAQRFYRGCVGRARWWRLREAVASQLLTNTFRMLINRRRYDRSKRGTIRYQGLYRGHMCRRVLASIRVQTYVRMRKRRNMYRKLKSASIALQCAQRCRVARSALASLKHEQKDIGKLKENNEKLKLEMASLKAMLAAQAKGDASRVENERELEEKENQIAALEKRIAELESALEVEKETVKKLEEEMVTQKEQTSKQLEQLQQQQQQLRAMPPMPPASPRIQRREQENVPHAANAVQNTVVEYAVSPEMLAEHRALVAKLEDELEAERGFRRQADSEIIKLRAAINGVTLDETEVKALLAPKLEKGEGKENLQVMAEEEDEDVLRELEDEEYLQQQAGRLSEKTNGVAQEMAPEVTGAEEQKERESSARLQQAVSPRRDIGTELDVETEKKEEEEYRKIKEEAVTPEVVNALGKLGVDAGKNRVFNESPSMRPMYQRSPSEYFPMIRRGFAGLQEEKEEEEEAVMAVGWKVEVTTRKEREEALRDEVRRFEVKMKRFYPTLEEGIDVTMWQLNRNAELSPDAESEEFALKASPVNVKLHRRGDLLIQAVLTFNVQGGYLRKALGRHRGNKAALEPLSLHDILEIKAGCVGYDHTELPSASAKTKGKSKNDNKHSSLFLTLKASPTPLASQRSYFLRFKSRSARNDLMTGLRGLLADLQIHEGVSISSIHTSKALDDAQSPRHGRRMPNSNAAHAHSESHIPPPMDNGDIVVPLKDVHEAINKEREIYDRLLLMMLQGNADLKEKEDELLMLRGKLDSVSAESAEKDRVQANDSKLIMQLSKKLETLLMDNEDLRDQNDRLNTRLVAVECEKMNLMST